jgi:hypothetical protein
MDQIEIKKEYLAQLEKSEEEARRLDGALAAAGIPGRRRPDDDGDDESSAEGGRPEGQAGLSASSRMGSSTVSSTTAGHRKSTSSGASGGYGFLSALSHSITGLMDGDPEATRRSNISKTRDTISQLEDALHHVEQDLKYASQTIQADLDRFQRQKVADVRDMCLALASAHRDWCQQVRRSSRFPPWKPPSADHRLTFVSQNLEAWLEAKNAVEAIGALMLLALQTLLRTPSDTTSRLSICRTASAPRPAPSRHTSTPCTASPVNGFDRLVRFESAAADVAWPGSAVDGRLALGSGPRGTGCRPADELPLTFVPQLTPSPNSVVSILPTREMTMASGLASGKAVGCQPGVLSSLARGGGRPRPTIS